MKLNLTTFLKLKIYLFLFGRWKSGRNIRFLNI